MYRIFAHTYTETHRNERPQRSNLEKKFPDVLPTVMGNGGQELAPMKILSNASCPLPHGNLKIKGSGPTSFLLVLSHRLQLNYKYSYYSYTTSKHQNMAKITGQIKEVYFFFTSKPCLCIVNVLIRNDVASESVNISGSHTDINTNTSARYNNSSGTL